MAKMFTVEMSGKNNFSRQPSHHKFEIAWEDVKYTVTKSLLDVILLIIDRQKDVWANRRRRVLKGVSGRFVSGELCAVMGSSGAGKSTLLEVVMGIRVKGKSGKIHLHSRSRNTISMSYVPQHDNFFPALTARETIIFASKLKNSRELKMTFTGQLGKQSELTHEDRAQKVIELLDLGSCADTKVASLSGGQMRRLSVAKELVYRPDVLILDEPTTGLDSAACVRLVEVLRDLTQATPPVAVVCTIHQPSYMVFTKFHRIYALSSIGKCIYDGPPTEVLGRLSKFDLICPEFYNPADFLMDVAGGEYGFNVCHDLAFEHEADFEDSMSCMDRRSFHLLSDSIENPNFKKVSQFFTLTRRSLLINLRDPWLFGIRLVAHAMGVLIMIVVNRPDVGQADGCPPHLPEKFDPKELERVQAEIEEQYEVTKDNLGSYFFSMMIIIYCSAMAVTLTFPIEVKIVRNELWNRWYSRSGYYWAKLVADFPFQVFFALLFSVSFYHFTNQPPVWWRMAIFLLTFILFVMVGQSLGLLVGAVFMKHIQAACFMSALVPVPFFLFTGYFIKTENIPIYLGWMSYMSYKYCYDSLILSVYGFQRCSLDEGNFREQTEEFRIWFGAMLDAGPSPESSPNGSDYEAGGRVTEGFITTAVDQLTGSFFSDIDGRMQSMVMEYNDLLDEDLIINLVALTAHVVVLRVLIYVVLVLQTKSKE